MKLTKDQRDAIALIGRSKAEQVDVEGWRRCAPNVFEVIIKPMPVELVENKFDDGVYYCRLTSAGQVLLEWVC